MRLFNIVQMLYHIEKSSSLFMVDCLSIECQRDLLRACKQLKHRLDDSVVYDSEQIVLHNFVVALDAHLLGSCHVVVD